ncbi:kelch-like protein 30 [Cloeon dipterum]|uniref:kelch-like protein 30 n=1 Tax=Cloeon dipterum TaxID=197152 RepID=UPI00322008D6
MTDKSGLKTDSKHSISVIIEGKTLNVGRDVLIKCSTFFETALHPRQTGFIDHDSDTFPLSDLSLENFEAMLEYFTNCDDELKLKQTLSKYKMTPALYLLFSRFMVKFDYDSLAAKSINLENVYEFKEIAEATGSTQLERYSQFVLHSRFLEFRKTVSYRKLDLKEIVDYLGSRKLMYSSEKEVLEAVIWWIKYDVKNRANFHRELFTLVDWSKITKAQIKFALDMKTVKKCPGFVAQELHSLLKSKSDHLTMLSFKKMPHPLYLMLEGVHSPENEVKELHPREEKCFTFYNVEGGLFIEDYITTKNHPQGCCVAFYEGSLIVFGGIFNITTSNWNLEIKAFNLYLKVWTTIGRLQTPRRHFQLVQVKDEFYLLGGFTKYREPSLFVEKFHIKTGETTMCAKLLSRLQSPVKCCHVMDHICVFSENRDSSVIYKYSIMRDVWTVEHLELAKKHRELDLVFPYRDSVYLPGDVHPCILRRKITKIPEGGIFFSKAEPVKAFDNLDEIVLNFFTHDCAIFAFCSSIVPKPDGYSLKSYDIETKKEKIILLPNLMAYLHQVVQKEVDFVHTMRAHSVHPIF